MRRRAFTLIELLVVIAIIAILAAILFPVFAQARETARQISCLSNMRQIGVAIRMYSSAYDEEFPMGTYPGPRNWEVNPDVNPYPPNRQCLDNFGLWRGFNPGDGGPAYTGCSYGGEFYRTLMHVQLGPFIKTKAIWYCPSDPARTPSPQNMALGLQSYQWFPNWIYNGCCGIDVRYPDGRFRNLAADPPSEKSDFVSERILFSERGMFGWDGADATTGACQPWTARQRVHNHARGYNAVYFDGHAKLIVYGKKWTTLPASGWGIDCRPR